MPYILIAILVPVLLIAAFIGINMYYDWKEDKHFRNEVTNFPDEVERLLDLDPTEMETYHKNI